MERQLFDAIKNDNLKEFERLTLDKEKLKLCYGKYPILTLLYIYDSKNIIRKYEKYLITIADYTVVEGYAEISKAFRKKAKKCLRFFVDDEPIDPIVMLAINEDSYKLASYFPIAKKTKKDISVLPKIYKILHGKILSRQGNEVVVPPKALTIKQKMVVLSAVVMSLVIVVVSVLSPILLLDNFGDGSTLNPYKIYNQEQFLSAIKANKDMILMDNISLSNYEMVEDYKGKINGNGKKLEIPKNIDNPLFKEFYGRIDNLNLVFGQHINVLSGGISYFIAYNYGTLDNINIVFDTTINERSTTENLGFSPFVFDNNGYISNCTIDGNIMINGDGRGNASFGGFAVNNGGTIQGCSVKETATITADTVDIFGIAIINKEGATIKNTTQGGKMYQTTSRDSWSPNVAGICNTNYGTITKCTNTGELGAKVFNNAGENAVAILVSGIVTDNYSLVDNCLNSGKITASSESDTSIVASAAGIVVNNGKIVSYISQKIGNINKCKNTADIYVDIQKGSAYIGGIACKNENFVNRDKSAITDCGASGKYNVSIVSSVDSEIYLGGVAAFSLGNLINCYSYAEFEYIPAKEEYIGGIIGLGYVYEKPAEDNNFYFSENIALGIGKMFVEIETEEGIKHEYYDGTNKNCNPVSTLEELMSKEIFW